MCAIYARNMTLFSLFLIIKDELLFLGDGIFWPLGRRMMGRCTGFPSSGWLSQALYKNCRYFAEFL